MSSLTIRFYVVTVMGSATSIPSIRGVGLFESTSFNGLWEGVSFAGGANAVIHAAGLQT